MKETKTIELNRYIKEYCNNKYSVFVDKSKDFPRKFEQRAYTDETEWYDEKNNLIIYSSVYIGD